MDTVRIHSKGFRTLFYFYHLSGLTGLLILLVCFLLSIFGDGSYGLLAVCGMLMIAVPLTTAPPEIIVLLKERRLLFRRGLKCSDLDFKDIAAIKTAGDRIEIRDKADNVLMKISQAHFKNIRAAELCNYITGLITGGTDLDLMRYTSVRCGRHFTIG